MSVSFEPDVVGMRKTMKWWSLIFFLPPAPTWSGERATGLRLTWRRSWTRGRNPWKEGKFSGYIHRNRVLRLRLRLRFDFWVLISNESALSNGLSTQHNKSMRSRANQPMLWFWQQWVPVCQWYGACVWACICTQRRGYLCCYQNEEGMTSGV